MKIVKTIMVALILVLMLPAGGIVSAQGEGQISGQITNKTEGGSIPEGQVVVLTVYQNSVQTGTQDTVPDTTGQFSFSGLETSSDYSYEISTEYLSVTYFTDMLQFSDNSTELTAELPIFEITESPDQIHVAASHIIIYPGEDHVDILEYYLFLNESDRTFSGTGQGEGMDGMATLRFSLLADASDFQATVGFSNDEVLSSQDGFFLITPLAPGMKEIGFSYSVSTGSGEYTYLNTLNYPVDGIDFLVSGSDNKIETELLEKSEPLQIEGNVFQHYTAENLAAGQQLQVSISQEGSSNSGLIILIVVVVLLLAGGIAFILYNRRNQEQESVSARESDAGSEALLSRLAKLDDDFEDGIIDEGEYRKVRDDLKAELSELMTREDALTEE